MARVTRNLPVRACKEVKIQSALHKTSSPFSDGFARFRNFALGFLLLGAIGIYAYPKIFNSVNSKLAGVIEEKLNVQLEKVGLVGSVSDANFVEGKGIQISGLELTCHEGRGVCGIQKALIHAPVQLPDLLAGNFSPTAIELLEVVVHVSRDPSGKWNMSELLPKLSQLESNGDPIPILIRNSKISFVDYQRQKPVAYEFNDLQLSVQPQLDHPQLVTVAGRVNLFGKSTCSFSALPSVDGTTQFAFDFSEFPINRSTLGLIPVDKLPPGFRGAVGVVSGKGSFLLENETKKISEIAFNADLNGVAVDHEKMPHIVSDCFGPIKVENGIVRADISGKIGSGQNLHGRFKVVGQQLIANPTVWRLDGFCKQMTMDHRLAKPFPIGVKTFFADFDPRGIVDVDFSLAHDKNGLQKSADATLSKLQFNFVKFPYPVEGAHGTVNLDDNDLVFDIAATEQGQPLHFTGNIMGMGQSTKTVVNFWNEGKLPIDDKLATAVATVKQVAPSLFAFRPRGFFQVTGQARKPHGQVHFDIDYDVQLIDCLSQHKYFEYPFSKINGKISVRNSDVLIRDVRGSNGTGNAICNGRWNPENGLKLKFDVHNATLDNQLADALTPEVRYVWDAIRPDGVAHYIRVDLTTPPGSETNVVIDSVLADPQNGSTSQAAINPLWFPYRIANMIGRIRIGDGKVRMDQLRGRHGKTWLACNAFGDYTTEDWKLQFSDLRVGSISVDNDLLNAVPESLRESLVGLNYRGNASATGTFTMGGSLLSETTTPNAAVLNRVTTATTGSQRVSTVNYEQPVDQFVNGGQAKTEPSFEMSWDVRTDIDQGAMNVGLEVDNVFGYATFQGTYDGENVLSRGTVAADSLHVMGTQITNVRGPLWIENYLVGVGSLAKPVDDPNLREPLAGNVLGGTIRLDGQSWAENSEDRFYVQTVVSNANLQSASAQLSPQLKEVGGLANLSLRLTGGETRESIQGDGLFQLRDANIYELPLVLAMLKTLKNRRTNRTAFDAGNADFTIRGNHVDLNRVELLGDAISLIGKGELDLRGQVGMNFYSVTGRKRLHIPIVSDLANASSQRIMWLKVDGTYSDPQIRTEILPGLNESMSDLFQVDGSQPLRWAQGPFTNTTQR